MPEFITLADVTPGTSGSWVDVDCSSHVPADAVGVILRLRNTNTGAARQCGTRKNGSTDTRVQSLKDGGMTGRIVGVDANRIFEAYIQNTSDLTIELRGYVTGDEAYLFANAVDKTPGTSATWTDIDITSDIVSGTAIAAIAELLNTSAGEDATGARKNGSTDNRTYNLANSNSHTTALVGIDSNDIFEGYVGDNASSFVYLLGYFLEGAGVTLHTNGIDRSLTGTSTWTNITAPSSSAIGGVYEVISTGRQGYGFRSDGSSETTTGNVEKHAWAFPEAGAGGVIEGWIDNTGADFYELGYFTEAGGSPLFFGSLI